MIWIPKRMMKPAPIERRRSCGHGGASAPHRSKESELHRYAEQTGGGDRDSGSEPELEVQAASCQQRDVGREGQEVALREVDEAKDSEQQCQSHSTESDVRPLDEGVQGDLARHLQALREREKDECDDKRTDQDQQRVRTGAPADHSQRERRIARLRGGRSTFNTLLAIHRRTSRYWQEGPYNRSPVYRCFAVVSGPGTCCHP